MALRSDLLARGYLPENIPPVFTSHKFSLFVDAHLPGNEYITKKPHRTRPSLYNASKRGHQRRVFSIPNPISAADAALFIEKYWESIDQHFQKSPFSLSRPKIDTAGPRAIVVTPHDEVSHHRNERLAASRYIVATDISRFFPSIYTHALPWAIHGRAASKTDTNPRSKALFFNRLDYILRQGQDGQTIGIPVGPDWSRIISEIIATAVDVDFAAQIRRTTPPLLRHVDDIWIGAKTRDEAEHCLYIYRSCLREYELDINELKTVILPANEYIPHFWPKELVDLLRSEFSREAAPRTNEQAFVLDRVFELSNRHNDDGIIKFALRRLDSVRAWSRHWSALEPFLLRCFVNYPHSSDYVARVVACRNRVDKTIDKRRWGAILNEFIGVHARLRSESEVCWALWLARELQVRIRKHVAQLILDHCGPMSLTLLWNCMERGMVRSSPDRRSVIDRLGERPLSGSFWLFAYEALRNGWIDRALVEGDPARELMQQMEQAEVTFFDADALPSALEGKDENEWETSQSIEDIAGEYENHDEWDDDDDEERDDDMEAPW